MSDKYTKIRKRWKYSIKFLGSDIFPTTILGKKIAESFKVVKRIENVRIVEKRNNN